MQQTILSGAVCAILGACAAVQSEAPTPTVESTGASFGIGAVAGLAQLSPNDAEEVAEGPTFGARIDVSLEAGSPYFEIGLRTGFAGARIEDDSDPDIDLEYRGTSVQVAPLARVWFAGHEDDVRPYLEGFVGWHRTDFEVTASGFGQSETASDAESGLFAGGGLGFAIRVSEDTRLVLGAEVNGAKLPDSGDSVYSFLGHVGVRVAF